MRDTTRERFAKTAERIAALQDERAAELEAKIVRLVEPKGDERALDSGSGAGALAFALAPHVREVVAVDLVPELLEQGRRRADRAPNVTFVEGDATRLAFEPFSFDLAGCLRTLHHLARPRGRCQHVMQAADRALDAAIDARPFDEEGRAGRRSVRLVVGPAVTWADQPQIGQPEIGHGARGKADILAELRVDENDGRRRHGTLRIRACRMDSVARS